MSARTPCRRKWTSKSRRARVSQYKVAAGASYTRVTAGYILYARVLRTAPRNAAAVLREEERRDEWWRPRAARAMCRLR
eukprot:IDg12547t1